MMVGRAVIPEICLAVITLSYIHGVPAVSSKTSRAARGRSGGPRQSAKAGNRFSAAPLFRCAVITALRTVQKRDGVALALLRGDVCWSLVIVGVVDLR